MSIPSPVQSSTTPVKHKTKAVFWRERFSRALPWLVILGAFTWSLYMVTRTHATVSGGSGFKVLHLGHSQLEPMVRVGLDQMIKEFEEIHPDVRIVQEVIPPQAYAQWLSTQLISGKALDILQDSGTLIPSVKLSYFARYFIPLTQYVFRPNPYNKGTELENVPWYKTYWDEMRLSYSFELQEYMSIPLSQFGSRVAVNLDLLKKLTGSDSPPTDYREFIKVCKQIREQKNPQGKSYIAIAVSQYDWGSWDGNMASYLDAPLNLVPDFYYSGVPNEYSIYVGFRAGLFSLMDPCVVARFKVAKEIADQCQTGFIGLTRPEAVFNFIQQRAVFMSCGSNELGGLMEQCKGVFNMKIIDYPRINSQDPVFGSCALGPPVEVSLSGFAFVVARNSSQPDLAVEFLQFLGSQKNNERLNKAIGWLPAVEGSNISETLLPYKPHVQGMLGVGSNSSWGKGFFIGVDSSIKWSQLYPRFLIGDLSYEEFAKEMSEYYRGEVSEVGFKQEFLKKLQGRVNSQRAMIGRLIKGLDAPEDDREFMYGMYARELNTLTVRGIQRSVDQEVFQHPENYSHEILAHYTPEAIQAIHRLQASHSQASEKPH